MSELGWLNKFAHIWAPVPLLAANGRCGFGETTFARRAAMGRMRR